MKKTIKDLKEHKISQHFITIKDPDDASRNYRYTVSIIDGECAKIQPESVHLHFVEFSFITEHNLAVMSLLNQEINKLKKRYAKDRKPTKTKKSFFQKIKDVFKPRPNKPLLAGVGEGS